AGATGEQSGGKLRRERYSSRIGGECFRSHVKKGKRVTTTNGELNGLEALTLTIPQAAQVLGISVSKTYEAARAGQLPTIRVGARVLISRRRLEALIDGQAESR